AGGGEGGGGLGGGGFGGPGRRWRRGWRRGGVGSRPLRGRGGRSGLGQPPFRDVLADGVARDAQCLGRSRDVAAMLAERREQPLAKGLLERGTRLAGCPDGSGAEILRRIQHGRRDRVRVCEQRHALDQVRKIADVPWPRIGGEPSVRGWRQSEVWEAVLGPRTSEVVID